MSFMVPTKTLFIEALEQVFDADYPVEEFRGLWVSMEYPSAESNYPGIWVDFRTSAPIQSAGIGHVEYTAPSSSGAVRACSRWRFAGNVTLTIVALTSLERDRMLDALVSLIAFGLENPATSEFRRTLESNDLIGVEMQWDRLDIGGTDETVGTPWGSDDVVYETTLTWDCTGEFVSEGTERVLVPLSAFLIEPRRTDEPDETDEQPAPTDPVVLEQNAEWH